MDANVYQIKVTLRGVRPPVWRRLRVPSSLTLEQLHQVLQIAMGWTNSHLHQFCVGQQYYGVPDPDDLWSEPTISESKVRLEQLARETSRFTYEHDFGDSWTHDIVIERAEPLSEHVPEVTCLGGRRACPPEDCGGTYGYTELVKALSNPKHPEHAEQRRWVGQHWQPEAFDVDSINQELHSLVALFRPVKAAAARPRSDSTPSPTKRRRKPRP